MGWLRRGDRARRPGIVGPPGAGVSSWHLWWVGLPPGGVAEVAVTIEVTEQPAVDRLYFWALQAGFRDAAGTDHGAAHLGPQWNPRHPGNRAVNWGGYARPPASAVLDGSTSPLPSTPDDPNTRDHPWRTGAPYRLTIRRGEGGWLGLVTDLEAGTTTTVRELHAGGDRLVAPVVWSEVFCHCDDPPAEVRWSGFTAVGLDGTTLAPEALRVNLPGPEARACEHLDVRQDAAGGVRQRSGAPRSLSTGAVLRLAGGG